MPDDDGLMVVHEMLAPDRKQFVVEVSAIAAGLMTIKAPRSKVAAPTQPVFNIALHASE